MELFSKTVAAIMLIILSPLLLLISAGSLFFQRFPILFKQERVGYKFQTFFLYKFRTMKINNVNQLVTEAGDKRITQWGKILRILKFDELPQLWNIVRGDMRFIGPRPEVQMYVKGNDFSFLEFGSTKITVVYGDKDEFITPEKLEKEKNRTLIIQWCRHKAPTSLHFRRFVKVASYRFGKRKVLIICKSFLICIKR